MEWWQKNILFAGQGFKVPHKGVNRRVPGLGLISRLIKIICFFCRISYYFEVDQGLRFVRGKIPTEILLKMKLFRPCFVYFARISDLHDTKTISMTQYSWFQLFLGLVIRDVCWKKSRFWAVFQHVPTPPKTKKYSERTFFFWRCIDIWKKKRAFCNWLQGSPSAHGDVAQALGHRAPKIGPAAGVRRWRRKDAPGKMQFWCGKIKLQNAGVIHFGCFKCWIPLRVPPSI